MNFLNILGRAKFMWGLPKFGALLLRLFRDARVSPALKLSAVALALLAISPLDILSDIPVIGVLDDAALLMLIANAFVFASPKDVVAEHKTAVNLRRVPDALELRTKDVTPWR